ncbi:MAG: MoaD/ThiS family protein [Gammaproteobacteria bacterium]
MKITLKLYATLGELLPAHAHENTVEIDVADSATPNQVIDQYRVPREMAHLILLNGIYVAPADRDKPMLKEGDAFAVWPPVAGG